jgi:hypothetical protein
MRQVDARNFCTTNGGILCSIASSAENAIVDSRRSAFGGSAMWIGIYRDTDTSAWKWYDNTPLSYQNWDSGEGYSGDGETVTAM